MAAMLLDGKKIAREIREEIKIEVARLKEQQIVPKLVAVLVGDDQASILYAKTKEKSCSKLGIDFELITVKGNVTEVELVKIINELNTNKQVHGIIIELPLPKHLDKNNILQSIYPIKDVDGAHPINRGYIMGGSEGLFPATPQSCIELMMRFGIAIEGKNAVIVGRGETVGKPLVFMLLNLNATVTVCHTKTRDLAYHTKQADILVVAAGKAGLIKGDMIKPGAVVVDAGINIVEGERMTGDVDFESASKVAECISPVPGGVGSITSALVQRNLIKAIKLQQSRGFI